MHIFHSLYFFSLFLIFVPFFVLQYCTILTMTKMYRVVCVINGMEVESADAEQYIFLHFVIFDLFLLGLLTP